MSKWNNFNEKDQKVRSYYKTITKCPKSAKEIKEFLECFVKTANNNPEIINLLRGLLHGANISSSKSGERIFAEHINNSKDNKFNTHLNKVITENNNKNSTRLSNIDIYLEDKNDSNRSIYIEFKDGGENYTYDIVKKAEDYLNRIESSLAKEAYIIVTRRSQTYEHYSKMTLIMRKNNRKNIKINCIEVGSEQFYELFPNFNVIKFEHDLSSHTKNQAIENVIDHINVINGMLTINNKGKNNEKII